MSLAPAGYLDDYNFDRETFDREKTPAFYNSSKCARTYVFAVPAASKIRDASYDELSSDGIHRTATETLDARHSAAQERGI